MSVSVSGGVAGGRPVRVALVGVGNVAVFHRDALTRIPGVELVALCDPDQGRARTAASQWGVAHVLASTDGLSELGVEVAHVLVPPDRHAEVAERLLAAGIAVLVEKPLALSVVDVHRLGELARARGVDLAVNHNYLHHPAFLALRQLVRGGAIGRLQHVRISHSIRLAQLEAGDLGHWMFREPRNIVFEQGVHALGLAHALLGSPRSFSSQVLATRRLPAGQPFHERWLFGLEAASATGEVLLSVAGTAPVLTVQAVCTDGWVEADLDRDLLTWEGSTRWLEFWNRFLVSWRRSRQLRRGALAGLRGYAAHTLGLGGRADGFFLGMVGSLTSFYQARRAGVEQPTGAEHAAEVLRMCELAAAVAAPAPPPLAWPAATAPRPGETVVLGASGFIGRRLLERLRAKGVPTTAVVRRRQGLPQAIVDGAAAGWLRMALASLDDPAALAEAITGAEVVLHLATGSGKGWPEIERNMVEGTLRLAELCLERGVRRLVFVSSIAAVYLGPDAVASVPDDHPADPLPAHRDLYSRGKVLAEERLRRLCAERGLPLVIVRPGVVVGRDGPLQHPGFGLWVGDNHCVGWGMGDHPLPLVLVEDVAEALAQLATPAAAGVDGHTLHLCAAPPISARQFVAELARATGRPLVFHPRPLWLSQCMEIGKWLVKRAGRRRAPFPAYRDLKSRALVPAIPSELARTRLGWSPTEERERFLQAAVPDGGA